MNWRYSLRFYPEVLGTAPVGSGSWQLVREDGLFCGEWTRWTDAVRDVFS